MSIVVLTSRGQDPAEFENHFSRGIKLPRNAEICLCGASLTKADATAGITIAGENNDSFLVIYGNPAHGQYAPYGSYRCKVKPGIYSPSALASEIINALAVGNYNRDFLKGNFSDIPVSPLRLGLLCNYDSTNEKMKYTVDRHYVRSYSVLPDDLNTKFEVSCGQDLGGSPGTIPGTVVDGQLFKWREDERYCGFYPRPTSNCILKRDCLWNGSNGAAPLQPTQAPLSTFGGAGNDIIPAYQYGWRWGVLIDETLPREYVLGMRGGIITSNKVWNETTHTGYDIRNEASNEHDIRLDWAVGGAKWDLWWEVEEFVPAQGAPGSYNVGVYYHPIPKEQTGNEVWDRTKAVKVGEGRFGIGAAGTPRYNEIVFRPVDGTLGTDNAAYEVPAAADQNKCCIDFRVNSVDLAAINAPQPGASRLMNVSGNPGYIAITDGGQFDLYKRQPIYMGYAHANANYIDVGAFPDDIGAIMLQGIEHEQPTTQIQSMTNINYTEWVDDDSKVVNPEYSFLPVNFAFSPLIEGNTAYREFAMAASTRFSNIAGATGFIERRLHTLQPSQSNSGLSSDFAVDNWESVAPLAVVQMPNLAMDGDLGGGNSVWGGAVSANILGVVPTQIQTRENVRNIFYEPANENWIKIKNLGADSLDQLKVKITDTTGRKLTGLTPDSNIWIKIKCGSDGKNLTLEKRGAVNPVDRIPTAMDQIYRNY